MGFFEPLTDGLHRANGEPWISLNEFWPHLCGPGQNNALSSSKCRTRIVLSLKRLGKTEQIPGMHHTHDDLLTGARHLGDLETAMQEEKEI